MVCLTSLDCCRHPAKSLAYDVLSTRWTHCGNVKTFITSQTSPWSIRSFLVLILPIDGNFVGHCLILFHHKVRDCITKDRMHMSHICLCISNLRKFWHVVCYCISKDRLHLPRIFLCISNLRQFWATVCYCISKSRLHLPCICLCISNLRQFWPTVCYCIMKDRLHLPYLGLCISNLRVSACSMLLYNER